MHNVLNDGWHVVMYFLLAIVSFIEKLNHSYKVYLPLYRNYYRLAALCC